MDVHSNRAESAFVPTRWTLVLRSRGDSTEAKAALSALCEAYWQPVFRFLRQSGREEETARELTQEFFARLLAGNAFAGADPARGRFRSFLLGAVKHFLADVQDHERRQKRGGGLNPQSLDAPVEKDTGTTEQLQVADPATLPSDELFDRQWALAILEHALTALERELGQEGKKDQFDLLKPWLVGEAPGASRLEAAQKAGLSEGAFKVAIHRLRKRFRELVKHEIAQTLPDPAGVQEEMRYLVAVLYRAS